VNYLAVKAALYAILTGEQAPGARLAAVTSIGESWLNEVRVFPHIGIYFADFKMDNYAPRLRRYTFNFTLSVAARSSLAESTNPTQSDAYARLDTLLDDGSGNGLLPVLNDPKNYSLNGIAQKSEVLNMKMYDNLLSDKTAASNVFTAGAALQWQVTSFAPIAMPIL
jgi:hypothetical protein